MRTGLNSTGMKRHLHRMHPQLAALVEVEEDTYEVERIVAKMVVGQVLLYLVEWRGFGMEQATWEPTSHLTGAEEAIVEFEATLIA